MNRTSFGKLELVGKGRIGSKPAPKPTKSDTQAAKALRMGLPPKTKLKGSK